MFYRLHCSESSGHESEIKIKSEDIHSSLSLMEDWPIFFVDTR